MPLGLGRRLREDPTRKFILSRFEQKPGSSRSKIGGLGDVIAIARSWPLGGTRYGLVLVGAPLNKILAEDWANFQEHRTKNNREGSIPVTRSNINSNQWNHWFLKFTK